MLILNFDFMIRNILSKRNSKLIGIFLLLCVFTYTSHAQEEKYIVSSEAEFEVAHDSASYGDTIVWLSGTYSDIDLRIDKDGLYITAEVRGEVIFTDQSLLRIDGDRNTFRGFQFLEGDIGQDNVIDIFGDYNLITHVNIQDYMSFKYLVIREASQYCRINRCNFENRLNLDDQNILSVLVRSSQPGYHTIDYCSFKNFDGGGNDDGIEPIRIGLSTQGDFISRTVVEYCYFTQCNGDGEIISNKARQNVFRFNTFEDNPLAELVLRHGAESITYGNFFISNKGGIRVREGQDHYIYNNYFYDLADRSIMLTNDSSDPLDNINIAFNTFIDSEEIRLGGPGSNDPTNVTFANNIYFNNTTSDVFTEPTGTETWIGNVVLGELGITLPDSGITMIDAMLGQNNEGFYGLTAGSPAIDAAQPGFQSLPFYEGIEDIDFDILNDLMGEIRPEEITRKDVGCSEFPQTITIQPYATEENTGPIYLTTNAITSLEEEVSKNNSSIAISPNPVTDVINVTIDTYTEGVLSVELIDTNGNILKSISDQQITNQVTTLSISIDELPPAVYFLRAIEYGSDNSQPSVSTMKFIKI